jgi:hypothetical protein
MDRSASADVIVSLVGVPPARREGRRFAFGAPSGATFVGRLTPLLGGSVRWPQAGRALLRALARIAVRRIGTLDEFKRTVTSKPRRWS